MKPFLVTLLLFFWALTSASQAADLNHIQQLINEGEYTQAERQLDMLLKNDPENPQMRFTRGLLMVRQGKQEQAIQQFLSLSQEYPELPEPYNNLAVLYASSGQYEKARDALVKAIKTHPSYATAHENLGDIYARLAGQAYDKALSLDTKNSNARTKLALVNNLFTAPGQATSMQQGEPSVDKSLEDILKQTVLGWANAWSSQILSEYLGYYSANFLPADGRSLKSWNLLRKKRLNKPRFIEVAVEDLSISKISANKYTADFLQIYRSDTYQDRGYKQLVFTKENGRWRILSEVSRN